MLAPVQAITAAALQRYTHTTRPLQVLGPLQAIIDGDRKWQDHADRGHAHPGSPSRQKSISSSAAAIRHSPLTLAELSPSETVYRSGDTALMLMEHADAGDLLSQQCSKGWSRSFDSSLGGWAATAGQAWLLLPQGHLSVCCPGAVSELCVRSAMYKCVGFTLLTSGAPACTRSLLSRYAGWPSQPEHSKVHSAASFAVSLRLLLSERERERECTMGHRLACMLLTVQSIRSRVWGPQTRELCRSVEAGPSNVKEGHQGCPSQLV